MWRDYLFRLILLCAAFAGATLGPLLSPATAQGSRNHGEARLSSAQGHSAKTQHRASRSYFVEFRARAAATYGHMYVFYGEVNGAGEIIKSDIAGLHPAGDSNNCENCSVLPWTVGHLLLVPAETGASDGDLEEKYVTARYRVMLDAATYKIVVKKIARLKETPVWNALLQNCVSFGSEIASAVRLTKPGFIWLEPKDYVEKLRSLNGGQPQKALRFAERSVGAVRLVSTNLGPSPAR